MSLYIVLFPSDAWSIAKEFWQHTGLGISSRFAEKFSSLSADAKNTSGILQSLIGGMKMLHRHYFVKSSNRDCSTKENGGGGELISQDHTTYVEERYGRNLPLSVAASAKRALRRRLAGVLIRDVTADCGGEPCAGKSDVPLGPSSRDVKNVEESDVYLMPTGMSAIWTAHQCLLALGPERKSVCFG